MFVSQHAFEQPPWLTRAMDTLYAILPKTGEIGDLNRMLLARSHLSEGALARIGLAKLPHIDPWFSFGTTAAFVAVVLALACWMFRRRDF